MENKIEWYKKLVKKLELIQNGKLSLEDYIAEVNLKIGNAPVPKITSCGLNSYFDDLEKWELEFYCKECVATGVSEFTYHRRVVNGEVFNCKNCKTEKLVRHKPKEDNY